MLAGNFEDLIGKTPLLKLKRIEECEDANANIYAKLECMNPAGSIKDRAAYYMLKDAFDSKKIDKDTTIIEPTSGNTGVGLAAICASLGMKLILTMPETMSEERRKLLKAYGAHIELTDGRLGTKGAIDRADELSAVTENSFIPSQFSNPSNPKAHYETTAKEIADDLQRVDYIIAGVGSGGTITGIGRYFKENRPDTKIIAVEPFESAVLSGKEAGSHGIQGIGAGFVPGNYDASVVDEVIPVETNDAYKKAAMIAKKEGVFVGISSGAALCAALETAKRPEAFGANIVIICPDSGDRYLSTELIGD